VVVGSGFGGLSVTRRLRRLPVDVVAVDRNNFHTFQPLLYQVATAGLDAENVAASVRGIFSDQAHFDFRYGEVTAVDFQARAVQARDLRIPYDWLVLAAGATSSDYGVPGVGKHAFFLKTLAEAVRLRNHVLRQFEAAAADPSLVAGGALTVVVVGGGATGVELSGALVELFGHVLAKDFRQLDVRAAKVVLLEATDHLLGAFSPPSRCLALDTLVSRGVELRFGAAVSCVEAGAVHLNDGTTIPTRTVAWVAGVQPVPLVGHLGLPTDRGRIAVEPDLRVAGHPEVFAIGDLAAGWPQLAPVAIQQGRHVARQIGRLQAGRGTRPFRYRDKGTMATIGRNAAVAELPLGVHFGGFFAWVLWLVLHLLTLVGFRNRAAVVVNWGWNYLTYDRGARLILEEATRALPP
jgi:NADH dehydrogenase